MKSAIRKMGNSHGVIIPKLALNEIGAKDGDQVEVVVAKGKIILTPRKRRLREGWGEASKAIAAAEDDHLVWPQFGNKADKDWKW